MGLKLSGPLILSTSECPGPPGIRVAAGSPDRWWNARFILLSAKVILLLLKVRSVPFGTDRIERNSWQPSANRQPRSGQYLEPRPGGFLRP